MKTMKNPIEALEAATAPVVESLERLNHILSQTFPKALLHKLEALEKIGKRAESLDKTGWLPHSSSPIDLIDDAQGDLNLLKISLNKFYRENWELVRNEIEGRIKGLPLDAEAKKTFFEALDCHEKGLYRATVRLLFPEIERVSRKEIHKGEGSKITSQHLLKEYAGNLTFTDVAPKNYLSYILYKRLIRHFYKQAKTNDQIIIIAKDPIPNRHASLHGLVVYSTFQNSLNTIFMADYIFQIISFVKEQGKNNE